MSAAFEHYLQPPAPDPERAPDDTTEPVGPAVEDIDEYQQPPPSMLRPAHEWEGNASRGPRPWMSRPIGLAIAGFSLSLTGHLLTWAAVASTSEPQVLSLAAAPFAILAGILVSATALVRHRRGIVGGSGWAGAGLVLGILWALLAVVVVVLFMMAPSPDF